MSERSNPFDLIHDAIDNVGAGLHARLKVLEAGLARLAEKPPEWEELPHAIKRLGKHRTTIFKLLHDGAMHVEGKIRHQRKPSKGGNQVYLLHRADLDQIFPPTVK